MDRMRSGTADNPVLTMNANTNRAILPVLAALFVAAGAACGAQVPVPAAPPSPFPDTEGATNAPLPRAAVEAARLLRAEISLDATPSNNVEVAFGASRDGDGALLPGDESFAVGWENGRWFLASATNRVDGPVSDGPASRRTLSFEVRVAEDGRPLSFSARETDWDPIFSGVAAAPPGWLFSRAWDAVRTTVRGVDPRNESVSLRFDTDAGLLILR